ncbi:MAG: GNAT family N-acetyltransferase [Hyphomicrobiaceae bacterium]|nr:GNAT family N-acetyltransferase [Hyphomicrobiaceae bacterium]
MIDIRPMRHDETEVWAALRSRLWPDCGPEDNAEDIAAFQSGGPVKIVFIAFDGQTAVGFAEISERSVVDSCGNAPAAFLEGWFVEPEYQKQGVGGALIAAAKDWASNQNYAYLGSDAVLENEISHAAHLALGFEETGRVVNFRMELGK